MMETELNDGKLQSLIVRAWHLNEKLKFEIENTISFCRFCSNRGRYCDIAETPFEERERQRLIAIRDSLKEVQDLLLHLQRLNSWQMVERKAALTRLEESRFFLMKQVMGYQGRPLDTVSELNACFGGDRTATEKTIAVENRGRRRVFGFLVCWIRTLLDPWKWQSAVGFSVKLILISASLSSTLHLCHVKQQSWRSQRGLLSIVDSTEAGKIDNLLTISKSPLDVFCGRG